MMLENCSAYDLYGLVVVALYFMVFLFYNLSGW